MKKKGVSDNVDELLDNNIPEKREKNKINSQQQETKENNKRIAKNTLMLYFRMLLTMGVSLYTVRIVLETLGVVDYGIYNVVGGVVTMFSFLSATMASASQRFFAFELGRNNLVQLKKIFSITMTIYAMIALLILVLAETIGLWFLNTQMTIPSARMNAANWVYQFSIFSFMMTMFTVPYDAAIIAHEKMNVYAWVSIVEVILKLIIVYLLLLFSFDKLKLYGILIFGVTSIITLIYRTYTKRKFEECHFTFHWDILLFKEIVSFSGWNLLGSMAAIFKSQGINILLNVFFGPVVNAARGIAYQVNNAINQFVQNFMIATRPQITKYYATGEKQLMYTLVIQSSKFSYFLLFILSMPLLLETDFILKIWLHELPDYVVLFTRLVIINALVDSLSGSLITSALATGKIKFYQIIVGGTMLLNLPISYVALNMGFPPQSTIYVAIFIAIMNLLLRLLVLKNIMDFPIGSFFKRVIARIILTSFIAYIVPVWISIKLKTNLINFIVVIIVAYISSIISIYLTGLDNNDRKFFNGIVRDKILSKVF